MVIRRRRHPLKGPGEHQKRAKEGPKRISRPSSAARSEQTRPKRVPKRIWRPSLVDPEARRSSQETPRRAPRASKRRPREPQNAFKTIFGSKMMIFQKSSSRPHKINIFEGREVSLGAQNRPQEAPKRDKKRYRKKKIEKRRKEEHQERQKELQKALPPFDPATPGLRVKGNLSSLVGRGPQGAAIFARLGKHETVKQTTNDILRSLTRSWPEGAGEILLLSL